MYVVKAVEKIGFRYSKFLLKASSLCLYRSRSFVLSTLCVEVDLSSVSEAHEGATNSSSRKLHVESKI